MTKDTRTAAERWLGHKQEVAMSQCTEQGAREGAQPIGEIMGKSPFDLSDSDVDRIVDYFQRQRAEGRIKTPEPAPPKPKRSRRKTAPAQGDLFAEDATKGASSFPAQ
jgi:hypothetical protein